MDATCVICDECFRHSDHEGHEVYFHRTSPGGCCDCGDIEAWNIRGCCPLHRPETPPPLDDDDEDDEAAVAVDEDNDNNNDDDNDHPDDEDIVMAVVSTQESKDSSTTSTTSRSLRRKTSISPQTSTTQSQVASRRQQQRQKNKKQRSNNNKWLQADPMEAVQTAKKGQKLQQETLLQAPTALPPKTTAALATVIGAAVSCLVQAVNGAAIGADPIQFKTVWAQEATQIALRYTNPEESYIYNNSNNSSAPVQPSDFVNGRKLPMGYQLHLRLHNDDVHTFDEVIDALHEPRSSFRRGNEHHPAAFNALNNANNNTNDTTEERQPSLVPLREQANDMTHQVDTNGQVTVKIYDDCISAMQGYRRLKTRGLHCALVSTAQLHLEQRAFGSNKS